MEYIKPENKDERVHQICNYLQANKGMRAKCEKCPESYYSDEAECDVQRGCYTVAHETYRVAMTGKWYDDERPKEQNNE
jgi:hypothetical protein